MSKTKKTTPKKTAPVAKGAPAALLPLDPAARARVRAAHEHEAKVSTLQSPAELHYLARYWNWDEGLDALRARVRAHAQRMASNDACVRARTSR